jgi:hypothetical protein
MCAESTGLAKTTGTSGRLQARQRFLPFSIHRTTPHEGQRQTI